jgi:hypothetical protein
MEDVMAFWSFANRPAAAEPAAIVDPPAAKAEISHAYERGREDQRLRSRRRGFGLLGVVLVAAAALGALVIVLAVRQGSFAAGGAVVDAKLSQATGAVTPAIDNAAAGAGSALQAAGQSLKDKGAALSGQPPASGSPKAN